MLFLKLGHFLRPGREKSFDLPLRGMGQKTSTPTQRLKPFILLQERILQNLGIELKCRH